MKVLLATAAALVASPLLAQSAFQGFYGQIGAGYEGNTASGLNSPFTATDGVQAQSFGSITASNQSFGGVPLVVGLGYNFSVAPKWLIGLGVDYSALSQESSGYKYSWDALGINGYGYSFSGAKIKTSNRYNIFLSPSYEISEDKLVYLKAGYSAVQIDVTAPSAIALGAQSASLAGIVSNQSKTVSGYMVGLGYKQFITSGVYAFGETNYMSYGSANFGRSITIPGANVSLVTNTSSSLSSYQLLVGVGYQF